MNKYVYWTKPKVSVLSEFVWTWPRAKSTFTWNLMPSSLWFEMCLKTCLYPDILRTYLLTECLCDSPVCALSLDWPSCTCGYAGDNDSVLLSLSMFKDMIVSWLWVLLGSSLKSVLKHVLPHKNLIMHFCLMDYCCLYPLDLSFDSGPYFCIWESLIWKWEVGFLDWVDSFQTFFMDWPWLILTIVKLITLQLYFLPLQIIPLDWILLDPN